VNGCNLIPFARLQARRRARRIRLWFSVVPAFASLLMGVYGWFSTIWNTDTASVRTSIEDTDRTTEAIKSAIARDRAQISQSTITLHANKAVGEQPDWGVLLYILSERLGPNAVLNNCVLEALATTSTGGKAIAGARPGRFRLTLHGMAKDQEAVSRFVLALEGDDPGARLFDEVRLFESRRTNLGGKDAVSFRIECQLSDAAAGGK
jgi:hypothetical protein